MKDQTHKSARVEDLETVQGRTSFDGVAAFRVLQAAFEKAVEKNPEGVHESFYTFAGQRVRFRIVGRALTKHLFLPFAHLQSNGPVSFAPQLTIDLWDENEIGIRCQGHHTRRELTAISPDNRFIGYRLPSTFACLDRITNHIVGSVAWSDQISTYERARPLPRLLLEWHNDQNIQVIHAGLVARNGHGILFAAKSGSGKSTSSLACLTGGFTFLSEDFVGLQHLPDGSFLGHSLYNSVFLEASHLARFPIFAPYMMEATQIEKKSAVILSQIFPEQLACVAPIQSVIIPRVAGTRESKIYPASKGQALLALGPSSLLQIPSRRAVRGFNQLAQLIERVPCYWLESGYDLDSIPHCVEEVIVETARRRPTVD